MYNKSTVLALLGAALLGSGCASQATAEDKDPIQAAEAAINAAKGVDFEWRDSRKMLDKAKKAAAAGDQAKADKLAKVVKAQGNNAVAQSKAEAALWSERVPR